VILDTSAVVAMIFREPDHYRLERILATSQAVIGAPTLFEAEIVVSRRLGDRGKALLARWLEQNEVLITPFGESHREVAGEAFLRYGKGRHSARLNFGDCMSYATAKVAGEPLLFIGNDFAKTDIPPA
jgi:ribonuclease VapC